MKFWTLMLPGDPKHYGYFEDKETAKRHRKDGFRVSKGPDHPRLNDRGTQTTHTNGGNTGDGFRKTTAERRRARQAGKRRAA